MVGLYNGAVQKDAAVLTPFAACVRMPVPKSNKGASGFDESNSCWAEGYGSTAADFHVLFH